MKPFSRWVWHDAFCKPRYLIMSNSTCQKNAVSACTLTLLQAYLPWISIVPLKSELKNVVREKECEISIRQFTKESYLLSTFTFNCEKYNLQINYLFLTNKTIQNTLFICQYFAQNHCYKSGQQSTICWNFVGL